jgi:hyaluronan synthase
MNENYELSSYSTFVDADLDAESSQDSVSDSVSFDHGNHSIAVLKREASDEKSPIRKEIYREAFPEVEPIDEPVEKSFFLTATFRALFTIFALCIMISPALAGYILDIRLFSTDWLAVGLYGVVICGHYLCQLIFAYTNRRMIESSAELRYSNWVGPSVGVLAVGYREDEHYYRLFLKSMLRTSYQNFQQILVVVDGDDEKDQYMGQLFLEVMKDHNPTLIHAEKAFFTDIHSKPIPQKILAQIKNAKGPICILQQHEGKRRAMYTGFQVLIDLLGVEAVVTTDSDTVLDPDAITELAWMLRNPKVSAATGDVSILNRGSLISFMSYLRYWMAFNVERGCQSFFGCVVCVSGPLGIYRSSVIKMVREKWFFQYFLGARCSYGDDRHLTNQVLELGHQVKFTHRAKALTETPTEYFRWIQQQTRWSKSFFREYWYSWRFAHKQPVWMIYEQTYQGIRLLT